MATLPPWSEKHIQRITKIRANRIAAKNKLGDLIKTRNALKDEIHDLAEAEGKKTPSKTRLEKDHELVETFNAIDFQRSRIAWLADNLDKAIDDAEQGRLDDNVGPADLTLAGFRAQNAKQPEDDDEEDPEGDDNKGTSKASNPGKDPKTKQAPPAKRGRKPNKPEEASGPNDEISVREIGISDAVAKGLVRNSLDTIQKLNAYVDQGGKIISLHMISENDAAAIEKALGAWNKKHAKARIDRFKEVEAA